MSIDYDVADQLWDSIDSSRELHVLTIQTTPELVYGQKTTGIKGSSEVSNVIFIIAC